MVYWIILAALAILVLLLLKYAGAFHKIEVKTGQPPFNDLHIIYKFYKNSYSEACSAFQELNLLQASIKTTEKGVKFDKIGIYYDDPNHVPKGKQRYIIGLVMNESTTGLDLRQFKENGYKTMSIGQINNAVLADFPCFTQFSILLAVWLVYPKLKKFIKKEKLCAYPYIEYYKENKTEFVVPLSQQDSFLVPEYHKSD